ncbi:unnamed protein product [Meganyctiphanes norvegica]|uniref:Uncharacterized protein n=1 Tax=Meganyctiphanes norvegica TaxID=48144 RepID=A0AAV2RH31_MEGNR
MGGLELLGRIEENDKHSGDVEGLDVHEDKVVSGADDGKIKVWDSNLKLLKETQAFDNAIQRVVAHNGIVYALSGRFIKAFDLETLEPKDYEFLPLEKDANAMRTDGECIYVGDEYCKITNYGLDGTYYNRVELVEQLFDVIKADGLYFSVRDRGITVQEPRKNGQVTVIKTMRGRSPLSMWGNGYLACCSQENANDIVVYEKNKPFNHLKDIKGHDKILLSMVGWGTHLATGSYDSKVKLHDVDSGSLLGEVEVPGGVFIMSLATNGNGLLYAGISGGAVMKLKAD